MKTNYFKLYTDINGELVSHFNLWEFRNPLGWVIIHPATVKALELTRRDLNRIHAPNQIWIIITNTTRTIEQNEEMGRRLGWTDYGGIVAKQSRHLECYGGIAVDFKARNAHTRKELPNSEVGAYARKHFDYVIDNYADNHVHGDMRNL